MTDKPNESSNDQVSSSSESSNKFNTCADHGSFQAFFYIRILVQLWERELESIWCCQTKHSGLCGVGSWSAWNSQLPRWRHLEEGAQIPFSRIVLFIKHEPRLVCTEKPRLTACLRDRENHSSWCESEISERLPIRNNLILELYRLQSRCRPRLAGFCTISQLGTFSGWTAYNLRPYSRYTLVATKPQLFTPCS